MVTVALLGTDRRDPPSPLAGGLADLAADDPQPTPSQRLLQQVAGCAVAQRAGVLPGPSAPLLAPPDDDPRPVTPPSATATWRRLVSRLAGAGRRMDARGDPHRSPPGTRVGRAAAGSPPNRRHPARSCAGRGRAVGAMDDRVVAAIGVRGEEAGGDGGDRRAPRVGDRARSAAGVVGLAQAGCAHHRRRTVVGCVRHQPSTRCWSIWWRASIRHRYPSSAKRSAASIRRCQPSAWRSRWPTLPAFVIRCSSNWRDHEFAVEFARGQRRSSTARRARVRPRAGRAGCLATIASDRQAGGCRHGRWSPTCSAARCPTAR